MIDFDYVKFWKILLFSFTKKICTEIHFFFIVTPINVGFIFQIQVFILDCNMIQGRSQDLIRPLQDIAQNFDDDVIIMTLTSLSSHEGKTWKHLSIVLSR